MGKCEDVKNGGVDIEVLFNKISIQKISSAYATNQCCTRHSSLKEKDLG